MRILRLLLLAILIVAIPTVSFAQFAVSITLAPPALPVYTQPMAPADGYLWTPGYWAYGNEGYFWVPGTWVMAPEVGFLWTPGYWGWGVNAYVWHGGYWGEHLNFYGGVNYGFASSNHALLASVNHGRPAIAATAKPAAFGGHGVVAAKQAGAPYKAAENHAAAGPDKNKTTPHAANSAARLETARNTAAMHAAAPRPSPTSSNHNAPRSQAAAHAQPAPRAQAAPRPEARAQRAPRPAQREGNTCER